MPLHEASSLVLQVVDSLSSSLAFPFQASGGALQGAEELLSDLLAEGDTELDVAVGVGDGLLDCSRGEERQVAAVLGLPAVVEEVVVLAAVAAGGDQEPEPALAAGTEDGALEVVLVKALPFTGLVTRGEDLLDLAPDLRGDERLVTARVLLAFPLDDADVEDVAEHVSDLRRARLCPDSCANSTSELIC